MIFKKKFFLYVAFFVPAYMYAGGAVSCMQVDSTPSESSKTLKTQMMVFDEETLQRAVALVHAQKNGLAYLQNAQGLSLEDSQEKNTAQAFQDDRVTTISTKKVHNIPLLDLNKIKP